MLNIRLYLHTFRQSTILDIHFCLGVFSAFKLNADSHIGGGIDQVRSVQLLRSIIDLLHLLDRPNRNVILTIYNYNDNRLKTKTVYKGHTKFGESNSVRRRQPLDGAKNSITII